MHGVTSLHTVTCDSEIFGKILTAIAIINCYFCIYGYYCIDQKSTNGLSVFQLLMAATIITQLLLIAKLCAHCDEKMVKFEENVSKIFRRLIVMIFLEVSHEFYCFAEFCEISNHRKYVMFKITSRFEL
jgi:hypothetical protein